MPAILLLLVGWVLVLLGVISAVLVLVAARNPPSIYSYQLGFGVAALLFGMLLGGMGSIISRLSQIRERLNAPVEQAILPTGSLTPVSDSKTPDVNSLVLSVNSQIHQKFTITWLGMIAVALLMAGGFAWLSELSKDTNSRLERIQRQTDMLEPRLTERPTDTLPPSPQQ